MPWSSVFGFKGEPEPTRVVHANSPQLNAKYPNNKISNTKYSVFTFIPLNLYEQFRKFMNLYFLLIGFLQLWSVITPVNPLSTWGAIGFIFALSATKEAIDDYRRFIRDKKANTRPYEVLRDGRRRRIDSEKISVGDILYLEDNSEVPCDLVILCSSDRNGLCYVQTANLDGETDYKQRRAPSATVQMSEAELLTFTGVVECAAPNAEIYRFDSRMKVNSISYASDWVTLSATNTLLQATHLRNTSYVYGLVVYTGNETKIGKNKQVPPSKWTKLDRSINQITMFIFTFQLILVVIFGAVGESLRQKYGVDYWYLGYPENPFPVWYEFMVIPLRFLLLNSTMIPISLKVTMDVIKYAYSIIIEWDIHMYHEESNTPTTVNNTAISEDLGQIEYLFTDKTGTLTENIMLFKRCFINGVCYASDSPDGEQALQTDVEQSNQTREFFRALALCHTVVPEASPTGGINYKSSSPDEEALVNAAAKLNVVFMKRDFDSVELSVLGNPEQYDWLHVLEFSSERKRMSVILRDRKNGNIILYIKGADDMIFPRLSDGDVNEAQRNIEEFAQQGLRTLCIAARKISEEEYAHWDRAHTEAVTSLEHRAAKLAQVYETIEKDLMLLGVSAIEDKLQDEVPETIAVIRAAGVKVWMLTGDKFSTAVQIGIACNLIARDRMDGELLNVTRMDQIPQLISKAKGFAATGKSIAVIVEGHVLSTILPTPQLFMELSLLADTVICCRVTPTQKAEIVENVKVKGFVTLAIGDGGNDVGMIQKADVGVGIAGREGMQAARASDYSVGRFKYLQRLMLIHGRYSYHRTAFVANYSFYKSLFICFMQILYQFTTTFSGTSFLNSLCLTAYNVIFTGLPVMGYVFDKDLSEQTIMSNPFLYRDSQSGRSFNLRVFISWFVRALVQSVIVYLVTVNMYALQPGTDYASIGLPSFTIAIIVQSLTVAIESHYITYVNHMLIWGTLASYFVVISLADRLSRLDMYSSMSMLYSSSLYWLCVLLVSGSTMLPIIALKYIGYNYFPTPSQILSYLCHFSIPFTIPFANPRPSNPSLSSNHQHHQYHLPHRRSTRNFLFTDPDSQWVVQMIRFEEPEEWGGEGGKLISTTDKTPLLLDSHQDRFN